jgi:hypothetical protein
MPPKNQKRSPSSGGTTPMKVGKRHTSYERGGLSSMREALNKALERMGEISHDPTIRRKGFVHPTKPKERRREKGITNAMFILLLGVASWLCIGVAVWGIWSLVGCSQTPQPSPPIPPRAVPVSNFMNYLASEAGVCN